MATLPELLQIVQRGGNPLGALIGGANDGPAQAVPQLGALPDFTPRPAPAPTAAPVQAAAGAPGTQGGILGSIVGGPDDPNLTAEQNNAARSEALIQSGLQSIMSQAGGIEALAEGVSVGRQVGAGVRDEFFARDLAQRQRSVLDAATRGVDLNSPQSLLNAMSRLSGPAALGSEGAQKTMEIFGSILESRSAAETAAAKARLDEREKNKTRADGIIGDYDTRTKDFRTAARAMSEAITAPYSDQGVQTLIKMLEIIKEPTSIVRNSEFEGAAQVGNAADRIGAVLQRWVSGERVTENQYNDMIDEVKRLGTELSRFYQADIETDFTNRARLFLGGDSDLVVDSMKNPFESFNFAPQVRVGVNDSPATGSAVDEVEAILFPNG